MRPKGLHLSCRRMDNARILVSSITMRVQLQCVMLSGACAPEQRVS
jgi:hypothetical protein